MTGRLERIPLREVWAHEAHDFTVWMESHINELDEVLGLGLADAQREHSTGTFSVDLVVETEGGKRVVIENQLGKSDHDHLGKLITYLASVGADAAVWVTPEARPEHVQAVAWLNESTSAAFYLVKVDAVRIGDSLPAPVFTLLVGPSEASREVGEIKREISDTHGRYLRFWNGLLERSLGMGDPHPSYTPRRDYYMGERLPDWTHVGYYYVLRKNDARVELYVGEAEGRNTVVSNALREATASIETAFGEPLEWIQEEGRKVHKLIHRVQPGWSSDEINEWPELQRRLVDAMVRLQSAVSPTLDQLQSTVRR